MSPKIIDLRRYFNFNFIKPIVKKDKDSMNTGTLFLSSLAVYTIDFIKLKLKISQVDNSSAHTD